MTNDGQGRHGTHNLMTEQLDVEEKAMQLLHDHVYSSKSCRPQSLDDNVSVIFQMEEGDTASVICGNCRQKLGTCKVKKV